MKRILYFDCFAGASGDMILGALLGLREVSLDYLISELDKLGIKGFEVHLGEVNKKGIAAFKADVVLTEKDYPHRGLADIESIIKNSSLDNNVKNTALIIFKNLAQAEAKVHGTTVDKIHFHEVGAVDAIVDIVGAAILIHKIKADEIYVSSIHTGSGFVNCAHGKMPVPAPATLELLKGIPIYTTEIKGELITPTGAAILSTVATSFEPMPLLEIEKIGYGAGSRELDIPNVLRISLGYKTGKGNKNTAKRENGDLITQKQWLLECNIDDMNSEFIDYIMEQLFQKGAKDVYLTPIQMKKNRPAVKISVLYEKEKEPELLAVIFKETSSIGIRTFPVEKVMLKRENHLISTPWGKVNVKVAYYDSEIVNIAPEYEDCRSLAMSTGTPIISIYQTAVENFKKDIIKT
jgi:uncharacterized protein (TIGR00299 family) protein